MGLKSVGFPEAFGGPGGFKKLREACRKNFHLVAPLKNSVVTNYDQKNDKINDQKSHDHYAQKLILVKTKIFNILTLKNSVFLRFTVVLDGVERSRRPVGRIST